MLLIKDTSFGSAMHCAHGNAWCRRAPHCACKGRRPSISAGVKRLCLVFALLVVVGPSLASGPAERIPSRAEVKYRLRIGGILIGEGFGVFQQDGKTYSVVMESRTVGIAALYRLHIRSEARGKVTAEGLRPLSFVETRNGRFRRSASFDWAAGQLELTDGDKKQTVQLRSNTWDIASLACAFSFARPDGKDAQLYMTDGRRLTEYKYSVVGRERLVTPLGELDTVHVKKILEGDDKRGFDAWLAVDRHFLVVRARATEKSGIAFDWTVESADFGS